MSQISRQIAVIDPAGHTPEIECFNKIAWHSPVPCTYHLPLLGNFDSIYDLPGESLHRVIILGSAASVHDDEPWQTELWNWLEKQMERKIPILGICYAHQLIAYRLGGSVSYANTDHSKILGSRIVEIPEFGPLDLTVSHAEIVTDPGPMEPWGKSSIYAYDALQLRDKNVFSVQPHPEATSAFLKHQNIQVNNSDKIFTDGYRLITWFLNQNF